MKNSFMKVLCFITGMLFIMIGSRVAVSGASPLIHRAGSYRVPLHFISNGVHTIFWSVSDDAGNSDDIGSRYFRVMNVVNPSAASAVSSSRERRSRGNLLRRHEIPTPEEISITEDLGVLEIKERQRIQVEIGAGFSGFMPVGKQLRPLPPGSFLDTSQGILYWQAGNGFIGDYRVLFFRRNFKGQYEKKELKVVIQPAF